MEVFWVAEQLGEIVSMEHEPTMAKTRPSGLQF